MFILRFQCERVITGAEKKMSKNGNEYIIFNFLDDNGRTFSCVSDVTLPSNIKILDKVNVEFEVKTGRYINLRVVGLWK